MRPLLAAGTIAILLSGCGSPPTVDGNDSNAGGADAAADGMDTIAEVLAELDGLEGEARHNRLVELAQAEGEVNVYTSNTDASELGEEFEDQYGVSVNVYRAPAHVVVNRLLQEHQAGFRGADFADTNAKELIILSQEGLFAPYGDGPAVDGLPDVAVYEDWTATRFNLFVVPWNTDLVPDAPTSLEDLTDPAYQGLLLMESRAFDWYLTIHGYFLDQGWTEEEIDELFRGLVANATVTTRHTTVAQFVAAGEFGVAAATYNHLVDRVANDGAPVTWHPPIEPVVVRPNGVGLIRTAQNPAAALLLYEWQLTDAQPMFESFERVSARDLDDDERLRDVEVVPVDDEKLVNESAEWESRYEELIRAAEVREED
jgi:iron(III) transport system substrate-binding protein